ncbi:hypothetical protein TNCV_2332841 [Trichonephila clavipes]|nr:hypothetical protein TNCV_2332841 [Trichonephila clavipes]
MAAVDFLHHENPPTWAGVEPAPLGVESQRQTNHASKHPSYRNEKEKSLEGETYRRHSRWKEAGASFNTDPSSDERQMRLNIVKCSN